MLTVKKAIVISIAAVGMLIAACRPTYYGIGNHKPARPQTANTPDTAMGGDAMKKDSTIK